MIVKMKKIALVVQASERREALKSLRKLSVAHLDTVEGSSEELSQYKANNTLLEKAIGILSENKLSKQQKSGQIDVDSAKAIEIAGEVAGLSEQKKSLLEKISNDSLEVIRIENWGNFNPEDLKYLSDNGVNLQLYEIPASKYKDIEDGVETLLINKEKGVARFAVLKDSPFEPNERPAGLPPEAYQVVVPAMSLEQIKARIEDNKKTIVSIDAALKDKALYLETLKKAVDVVAKDIELENFNSGAGTEEKLSWVTGYVPEDELENLKKAAAENNWAIGWDDPADEDPVPTKLKNNKLVSLIYPLTDFLDVTPGYHEFDISSWFLLFFSIFFGMIFGDAGYGSIVTVAVAVMMLKYKLSGNKVPDVMKLVLLLGGATIVWGTLTCNWFGIAIDENSPAFLQFVKGLRLKPFCEGVNIPWLATTETVMIDGVEQTVVNNTSLTSGQVLQIFCFSLGLLQLSVAHIKCCFRNIGEKSLKAIGDFGSLIQLWGMFYIVMNMVVASNIFTFDLQFSQIMGNGTVEGGLTVAKVAICLIGAGFAMSYIFSNYEGSLIKSILESTKNIISVALGVVNVFSDIVSYIRLWAVGLAGSAISATVNEMAGPLFGHFAMFAVLVLLLVFGHGLNMVLNLLSVIVHGVRLNTMEFSQHLGMSWSGIKYRPFSENK